jgi:hypothetical protein
VRLKIFIFLQIMNKIEALKKLLGTSILLVFLSSTFFIGTSLAGADFFKPDGTLTFEGIVDCSAPTCNGYITVLTSSTNEPVAIKLPQNISAPPEDAFVKVQAKEIHDDAYDFTAKNIKVVRSGKGQYGTRGDPVQIFDGIVTAISCVGADKYIVVRFSDYYNARFKLNSDTQFSGNTCGKISDSISSGKTVEVKIWGKDTNNGFVAEKVQSEKDKQKDEKDHKEQGNGDKKDEKKGSNGDNQPKGNGGNEKNDDKGGKNNNNNGFSENNRVWNVFTNLNFGKLFSRR